MNNYLPSLFAVHAKTRPPTVLYHYTTQTGFLGIVEQKQLWATKVQYMNDATEFSISLNIAREHLKKRIDDTSLSRSIKASCATLLRSLNGLDDVNIFAVCFCEDGDLLSQWRGYAASDGGYSIGFNVATLLESIPHEEIFLARCIYDKDIQQEVVDEAINHCVNEEAKGNISGGTHGPLADILFRWGVFFKDESFAEEKEWRLVSGTVDFRHDKLKFRTGRSMIILYYAIPIIKNENIPIEDVFVGPCPHMTLATSAATSLLMQNGLRGPLHGRQIVFPSKIPFRNW
jgi:hypothetical protein